MAIVLLIIFILFPLATFLHELGHYSTARLTGIRDARIRLGLGPRMLYISHPICKIEIRLFYFLGAHTYSGRIDETSSFNRFLITLNGPLINAVAAFCIFGFYQGDHSSLIGHVILIFAYINLWIAIGNLLPFKINNRKSDGYIVMESLWGYIKAVI